MSLTIFVFILSSCVKKVVSEGTVYSKKGTGNTPVPNVAVYIRQFTSGSDEPLPGVFTATTDENGHFRIFERAVSKNRSFSINCDCNEGLYWERNLSREDLEHYNIHLKQKSHQLVSRWLYIALCNVITSKRNRLFL